VQEYSTHNLLVNDKQEKYFKVIILENTRTVMTTCTCTGFQKCVHVLKALSGIEGYVDESTKDAHKKMLDRLTLTKEGNELISVARSRLATSRKEKQPIEKFLAQFNKKRRNKR
jgi:hypothetical protein